MTSFRRFLHFTLLKAVQVLICSLVSVIVAYRRFAQRLRAGILTLILTLVYFLLVTPIALQKRFKDETTSWSQSDSRLGWYANEQTTSDPRIYTATSSGRDDLADLVRSTSNSWILRLYDILLKLQVLAEPPKEKELSADLYVLF